MGLGGAEHSMMATGNKMSGQPQRPTHGLVTLANAILPTLLLPTRQEHRCPELQQPGETILVSSPGTAAGILEAPLSPGSGHH